MKKIIFAAVVSFITLNEMQAQGTWVQKTNFGGTARFVATAFSIGTKGYIGTGRDGAGPGFTKDFWEWDQTTDSWTQKADFGGTEKMAATGFSIGTKGYIVTGWDINLVFTTDLWEYDPSGNSWTQKADFPGAGRYRATAFSIGTKGYVGTGYNGATYMNDFWEWDQTSDTWSQMADFPGAARLSPVSFSIGTKGYMGTGGDGNYTVNYNDFYEWDQVSNTWTQIADFPGAPRMGASAFAIGCKGYVGTGVGSGGTSYDDFYEYDPSTDVWTQQTNYGGGTEAQAVGFSIGDKGYIGTGQTMTNGFWEFAPDSVCGLGATAFSVSDTAICEKFCLDYFDLSTNSPVSWHWIFEGANSDTSTQQNPTQVCYDTAGVFDVTLITCNQFGCDTLTLNNYITVHAAPPVPTITQNGNVLTSSSALTYQWFMNNIIIPGATNQSIVANQAALFTVMISDANGCTSSGNIDYHPTGIDEQNNSFQLSIYPNPSSGNFTVELLNEQNSGEVSIDVINTLGQKVFSSEEIINSDDWKKEIDLTGVARGIYYIRLNSENIYAVKKVVKY